MKKIASVIISMALVIIAINMTYSNISKTNQKSSTDIEEKVLPVIGRTHITFDGMGSSTGFLVKDGDNFKIIRYDRGSMASLEGFQPKYVSYTKLSNGETVWDPICVEDFKEVIK